MKTYVCGFAFDKGMQRVLLIKKNRPDWQKGLLNGIGGKIEKGEKPLDAMVREFCEETGYKTYPDSWRPIIKVTDRNFDHQGEIYFFSTTQDIELCRSVTDEKLIIIPINSLSLFKTIKNLNWLIPMALDGDFKRTFECR